MSVMTREMEAAMPDFFPGFEQRQIETTGATINLVIGGSGPPLLLLHGYPQTHVMWRKVAPRLAQDFTVVVPDLRGYGDSAKPSGGENFGNYSKRALALDQVEVMAALGHSRFAVAGHDRGARVTHRLLRDHPDKVTRGATLDIVPTLHLFETIDQKKATGIWHWFFLIQGQGLPEHMIDGDPEFFLRHMFATLLYNPNAIEPAVWAEYLRCFRNRETIRATCDEYRAAATIDLVHDRADLAQKVRVPMLVLWGTHSGQGSSYDLLKVWRDHADDVRGHGIDSGHFIPEEQPDRVYVALKEFFSV
jgi:haloacetate dehalogenase